MEHAILVPLAPPRPIAPASSPLVISLPHQFAPPSAITAAASWRERSLSVCQDASAAAATAAPVTSAPSRTSCDFKDKSTIHGVMPAQASIVGDKASFLALGIQRRQYGDSWCRCSQKYLTEGPAGRKGDRTQRRPRRYIKLIKVKIIGRFLSDCRACTTPGEATMRGWLRVWSRSRPWSFRRRSGRATVHDEAVVADGERRAARMDEGFQGRRGAALGRHIKVEIYPASQLGYIPATVEGVAMGTIDSPFRR